jgi:hypothetical protein
MQPNNQVLQESAKVMILNGAGVDGLATKQQTILASKGVNAITGDAPSSYASTTIIDNTSGKKPATLQLLKGLYGSNVSSDSSLTAQYSGDDFIVVLGQDQAN